MIMPVIATITVRVAFVEHSAFVTRSDPARAAVRRPRPIPVVPDISPAIGVPVAVDPDVSNPRAAWLHADDPGCGRSPDSDSDRNLGAGKGTAHPQRPSCHALL